MTESARFLTLIRFANLPGHSMLDLTDAVKAEPPKPVAKSAAKSADAKGVEPRKTVTMAGLRRLTLWGSAAAGALLIAALTSRSPVGAQRMAGILRRDGGLAQVAQVAQTAQVPQAGQVATGSSDSAAETQRLAETVRGLAASDERIKTRLAAVEHDLDDMTGAITKQIAAADASRQSADGPSVAATAAAAAIVPTAASGFVASPPATKPAAAEAASPALPRTAYGVDIGSGLTIEALRARWNAIRTAHPQLFEGLQPLVGVKEVPRANRVELRLLAGPFADAAAAARLCAALTPAGLFCQPTMFDGQHLALR